KPKGLPGCRLALELGKPWPVRTSSVTSFNQPAEQRLEVRTQRDRIQLPRRRRPNTGRGANLRQARQADLTVQRQERQHVSLSRLELPRLTLEPASQRRGRIHPCEIASWYGPWEAQTFGPSGSMATTGPSDAQFRACSSAAAVPGRATRAAGRHRRNGVLAVFCRYRSEARSHHGADSQFREP